MPRATPPSPLNPLLEGASVLLPLALGPVVEKGRGLQKEYGSCCHHLYQQGAPSLQGKGGLPDQAVGRVSGAGPHPFLLLSSCVAGHPSQGV